MYEVCILISFNMDSISLFSESRGRAATKPVTTIVAHLIGIGGIGMSAIAQLLHRSQDPQLQYIVQGSDQQSPSASPLTTRLVEMGIEIFQGHDARHLNVNGSSDRFVDLVIVSSGIPETNPELQRAKELSIPVLKRGEMLARLMEGRKSIVISGTHGKTTTTSLIGHVLHTANLSPTVINGGVMANYGSNVLIPDHEVDPKLQKVENGWWVAEGDESDGTMLLLPRRIAVVTNIDMDHMAHYGGSEENLMEAFTNFVEATLERDIEALAVLCMDCPRVARIYNRLRLRLSDGTMRNCVFTYGLECDAPNIKGVNPRVDVDRRGMSFNIQFLSGEQWNEVFVSLHGVHNLLNVLAAAAVVRHLGVGQAQFQAALSTFLGTKRRFEITGCVKGVTIIDDYAHHPAEIKATLAAAKDTVRGSGWLIAVHQPHRYSRLRDCYQEYVHCFQAADLVIFLPVCAAGEVPIPGVDSESLMRDVNATAVKCLHAGTFEEVTEILGGYTKPGDMVLCCGAGNVTQLAHFLPGQLNQCPKSNSECKF